MFVPKNNFKDKSVIPRGLKWQKASQGTKKGGKSLETYRAFLDRLQENQVKWNVWARIEEKATPDLLRSRLATGRRILLDGPFCREWYFGERVVRQSLGYDAFRVPKPVPLLSSRSGEMKELMEWFDGRDADEFLEDGGDYAEYKELRLMKPFSADQTQISSSMEQRARVEPAMMIGRDRTRASRGIKLPELPHQVDYVLKDGSKRFIDIPCPDQSVYPLPPDLDQAPRDYLETSLVIISGLEMLVRQMVMAMATAGLELPSTSGTSSAQAQKKRTASVREAPIPQKMSTSTRTRKGKEIATSHGPPVASTRSSIQTRGGKIASRGRGIAPSSRGMKATVKRRSKIPSPVVSSESDNDEDEDDSDGDESREEEDTSTEEEENEEDVEEDTDTDRPSKKAKK